jgi:hypothetical protein
MDEELKELERNE